MGIKDAQIYNNVGTIYKNMDDFKKAFEYYKKHWK